MKKYVVFSCLCEKDIAYKMNDAAEKGYTLESFSTCVKEGVAFLTAVMSRDSWHGVAFFTDADMHRTSVEEIESDISIGGEELE